MNCSSNYFPSSIRSASARKRKVSLVFRAITVISGIFGACSGDSGGSKPVVADGGISDVGGSSQVADAAPALMLLGTLSAFTEDVCGSIKGCCDQVGLPEWKAQCVSVINRLSEGKPYDASVGTACASTIKKSVASSLLCNDISTLVTICPSLLASPAATGKKPLGASCEDDDECAPSAEGEVFCGAEFLKDQANITRGCQLRANGKAGSTPCDSTRDGSILHTNTLRGLTTFPTKVFSCDANVGLTCNTQNAYCEPREKSGEGCDPFSGRFVCEDGTYCDQSSEVCSPQIELAGVCDPDADQCKVGAFCSEKSSTCMASLPNGATCADNRECASDWCEDENKCQSSSKLVLMDLFCGKEK
jgi:hypothetical protein